MRVGDFSVEVIGAGGTTAHELESGHVVARPGQVYVLRLRNHGPLRCVADVSIDGNSVTGNGLVIDAWRSVDLERPIHATERGRFTVIAEGDERVFGPDGGRDNAALGLIEARFRRELPNAYSRAVLDEPSIPRPIRTGPFSPGPGQTPPRRSLEPPDRTPLTTGGGDWMPPLGAPPRMSRSPNPITSLLARMGAAITGGSPSAPEQLPDTMGDEAAAEVAGAVERAAGTGLTGRSAQEFVPVSVGALEPESTVIRLRLVIGAEESLATPRPLPKTNDVPARPAPRP
jgi:hypothetical protein